MASDIWLRTIQIMKEETRIRLFIGYSFRLTVISYAHRSTDMIAHAVFFVASLVEEIKLILWHIVNLVSSCSLLILIGTVTIGGASCSSVLERLFVVRWAVGSIPRGGPIELFLAYPTTYTPIYLVLVKLGPGWGGGGGGGCVVGGW